MDLFATDAASLQQLRVLILYDIEKKNSIYITTAYNPCNISLIYIQLKTQKAFGEAAYVSVVPVVFCEDTA